MPPDTLGLSFLHKGSPQEGCSVLERQRLPKGLKKFKNMFFRNLSWENCFQRARIAPAKPGKKGGVRKVLREKALRKGASRTPQWTTRGVGAYAPGGQSWRLYSVYAA